MIIPHFPKSPSPQVPKSPSPQVPTHFFAHPYARAGDILVIWDTSTLCLDSQNFIDIVQTLQQRDISLQILAVNFLEIKPRSWESLVMLESYSVLANLEQYLS